MTIILDTAHTLWFFQIQLEEENRTKEMSKITAMFRNALQISLSYLLLTHQKSEKFGLVHSLRHARPLYAVVAHIIR